MEATEIKVFSGATPVGMGAIDRFDVSMGVAFGDFVPTEAYAADLHASLIEGERATPCQPLKAVLAGGIEIECELVSIIDYAASVGDEGREVEISGVEVRRYFSVPTRMQEGVQAG